MRLTPAVLLALLAGCAPTSGGGDAAPTTPLDAALDAAPDADPVDASSEDAEPDAAPDAAPAECLGHHPEGETFELFAEGAPGQIHGQAVFQPGLGLWVVFNQPAPERSDFDVWALRLGCTPELDVAPFLVDDEASGNDTDPSVTVLGDRALIAWQSGYDERTPNIELRYRVLDAEGAPLGPTRRYLSELDGAPLDTLHWMAALATQGEHFVLAGARAHPVRDRFLIFVQRLDAAGEPVGDALTYEDVETEGQLEPTVGVTDEGELRLAWLDGGQTGRVMRSVVGEAIEAPTDLGLEEAAGIRYSRDGEWFVGSAGRAFVAPGAPGEMATTRVEGSGTHAAPGVAPGFVGWFRLDRGVRSSVFVQRLSEDGSLGEVRQLETPLPGAPYPMVLTPAGSRTFMAWTEGDLPAVKLKGRFLAR